MEYTNEYGVRFKIHAQNNNDSYDVLYYTEKSIRPRKHKSFFMNGKKENLQKEMFYVLSKLRFCETCKDKLLGYREDQPKCQGCSLMEHSNTPEENFSECPVCYQKMFDIDYTKKTLTCQHEICRYCLSRMLKKTRYWYNSTIPVGMITCPLCRHDSYYDLHLYRTMTPFENQ